MLKKERLKSTPPTGIAKIRAPYHLDQWQIRWINHRIPALNIAVKLILYCRPRMKYGVRAGRLQCTNSFSSFRHTRRPPPNNHSTIPYVGIPDSVFCFPAVLTTISVDGGMGIYLPAFPTVLFYLWATHQTIHAPTEK
jgi:hypothetical protein